MKNPRQKGRGFFSSHGVTSASGNSKQLAERLLRIPVSEADQYWSD
jgi:hypothetical protein